MPRRRPPGRTVKRRVRTGCKTCRSRRIKCDEAKPQCWNCVQRGLGCDKSVQLKWEQEFVDRGLAFGRQGRWSKHQQLQLEEDPSKANAAATEIRQWCSFPLVRLHHFINSGHWDFDGRGCEAEGESGDVLDCEGTNGGSDIIHAQVAVPGPVCHRPSAYTELVNVDPLLLDYFLVRLCPLTTTTRQAPSPFAQLVIPLFSLPGQDDILRAVLALSARHRSINDPQWSRSAIIRKGELIHSLRKRLTSARTMDSWDPQILVMMMFLCLYEIIDNCDHRWVIHLRASKEIIQRSRQQKVHRIKDLGGLTTFTERFFAFQDVISRTACGNSALFGVEYWSDADQPAQIDSWMGCSPDLVSILCRIVEVSRLKTSHGVSAEFLERESAELEQRLEAMHENSLNANKDDENSLALAAELKRKAVLLYHHCVLYDACPSTLFVCELKRDILEGISTLIDAGLGAGLAFPIFVAAVELDPVDNEIFYDARTGDYLCGRRFVLEALEAMAMASLSNISRTRAVIQKVWRMRDMALEEDCYHNRPSLNDWETFVSPYSTNISLS